MIYRIRELRDMTGLSQKDFSLKYNIPLSTLRKWEQGVSSPPGYVIDMIASAIPECDRSNVLIRGEGDEVYYYNPDRRTVSDRLGNEISISEDIDGVKEQNLKLYLKELFDAFYEIQERFNRDCMYDKKEDVIWSVDK